MRALVIPLLGLALMATAAAYVTWGFNVRRRPPVRELLLYTLLYALVAATLAIAMVLFGLAGAARNNDRPLDLVMVVCALVGLAQVLALAQWWFGKPPRGR